GGTRRLLPPRRSHLRLRDRGYRIWLRPDARRLDELPGAAAIGRGVPVADLGPGPRSLAGAAHGCARRRPGFRGALGDLGAAPGSLRGKPRTGLQPLRPLSSLGALVLPAVHARLAHRVPAGAPGLGNGWAGLAPPPDVGEGDFGRRDAR